MYGPAGARACDDARSRGRRDRQGGSSDRLRSTEKHRGAARLLLRSQWCTGQLRRRCHAATLLRNKAARIGADYVEIMTVTPPYDGGEYFHNEYKILGIAYR